MLVSYYGAGLGDVGTTSLAANQPRSVLHSTALNDLMQRNWLRRSTRWIDTLLILLLIPLGAVARLFRGTLPLLLDRLCGAFRGAGRRAHHQDWLGGGAGHDKCSVDSCDLRQLGRRQSFEFMQRLKLRATMGLYFSFRASWSTS